MVAVTPQLLTAAAFWALPDDGTRRELVRGEVLITMPPGGKHGTIAANLSALLLMWAKSGNHGVVSVEAGFLLAHDPDVLRGPDISFVRSERIPPTGVPEAFWEQAPDLAIEIVSPSETAEIVREKVRDFLAAGTPSVWVIYPRTREVLVHRPDGSIHVRTEADRLDDPAILPGFQCQVQELFL
ncbi:MAG: Uma2 family endonuclease [Blastochloris sp.]|nr:Uma2 family endonuclease [Blastochloris sp.]